MCRFAMKLYNHLKCVFDLCLKKPMSYRVLNISSLAGCKTPGGGIPGNTSSGGPSWCWMDFEGEVTLAQSSKVL